MEARNQSTADAIGDTIERRSSPRFKFAVDIKIKTRTRGVLNGQTVDLSESGVSALLRMEVPLGELVELQFMVPFGAVSVHAIVRQRVAFRYGFQFVQSDATQHLIRPTCRQLAMERSLFERS